MIKATAFILIGGNSERFGSPKWKATISGQSVLDRIWNSCDSFEKRYMIGKEKPDSISYHFFKDELDIQAPINGLYTALNYSNSDWNFIISCDLPLMTTEIIQSLWTLGNHDADAIVPMVNDYFQLTCAFYHKRILKQIPRQIEEGDLSLHGLLNSIKMEMVIMDDNENEFTNMNTVEDLSKIKVKEN